MAECSGCRALEAQVVELQAQVRALRQVIADMSGLKGREDPYEDEAPLVVWEERP